MSEIITPSAAARLHFFVTDPTTGIGETGLEFGDIASAGYATEAGGVRSSTTPITLTSNADPDDVLATGQLIEFGNGEYGIDIPAVGTSGFILGVVTVTSMEVRAVRYAIREAVELDPTVTTKINDILEDTETTLPAQISSISSGGGDATLAKQEEILEAIDELSAIQLAAVEVTAGTIAGFPETLNIGDSYSEDTGQIRIDITDSVTGDPIDSLGSLEFADADVAFTAFRPNDSARIVGICEYVRVPSSGTLEESYVLVTLLTSETAKGKAEYTYEGRLKFVWQGPSSSDETDEEQKTYKTTPFKFIANP